MSVDLDLTPILAVGLVACLVVFVLVHRLLRGTSRGGLLAAQHGVARQLADKETLEGAAPRILQCVCEHLGWTAGSLWVSDDRDRLKCVSTWTSGPLEAPVGAGLASRVLRDRKGCWLQAPEEPVPGVASALAFPITCGYRVLGSLVFFSRRRRHPDPEILAALTLMGAEIGHFIERRRAARAVVESERRLRLVSDSVLDAVVTCDETGRILSWNHAAQDLFGYEPREVLGRVATMLLPPRYHDVQRHLLRRLISGGRPMHDGQTVRLHAVHKDGSEFPVEAAVSFWKTPEGSFGIGVLRDLGGRRKQSRPLDLSRDVPDPRWNLVTSALPGVGEVRLLVGADASGAGEALTRFLADFSQEARVVDASSACGLLEWMPDAVLIDLALPESPLVDRVAELRREAMSEQMPILLLCGIHLTLDQRQRLDRMGVDLLGRDSATPDKIHLWLGRVARSDR